MKITHSKEQITAFGGLNFCHDLLENTGVYKLIDNQLVRIVQTKGFSYSDIFANHLLCFFKWRRLYRRCKSTFERKPSKS